MMSDHAGDALEHTLKENVAKIYTSVKVRTYEKYCDVMLEGLFDAFYEAVQNLEKAEDSKSSSIRKFAYGRRLRILSLLKILSLLPSGSLLNL